MEGLVNPVVPLLVVILGPTGSGKTSLSVALGQQFDGEIVSCDSVAVYRGLEIGSAKPSAEQREQVPHHLLDVATPDAFYTAGDYCAGMPAPRSPDIAGRGSCRSSPGAPASTFGACCKGLFPGPNGQRRCAIGCYAKQKPGVRRITPDPQSALTRLPPPASTRTTWPR